MDRAVAGNGWQELRPFVFLTGLPARLNLCANNKQTDVQAWTPARKLVRHPTDNLPSAGTPVRIPALRSISARQFVLIAVVGGLTLGRAAIAQSPVAASASSVKSQKSAVNLADVPPLPSGKSSIMGGQIREIDPVRDRFVLHVYGEKPIKILYDERTQLFQDGNRVPLHDLKPAEHASVQTTLDGDKVFALSVHVLSQSPRGAFEGQVLDYDPGSGVLIMLSQGAPDGPGQQFRIRVTPETTVKREGQTAFSAQSGGQSDLVRGALVALNFQSDNRGQGTAQEITVLATPGSSFVFTGVITALNVAGGYLVVVDPRDERGYQIRCNPQDPVVLRLRVGDHVRVAAVYDGTRYAATRIEETGAGD
jgi:hypothetical protein